MNPKIINSINARLARVEALLENQDTFGSGSGATYGGLNFQGSEYNTEFGAQITPDQIESMVRNTLAQELANNYGFGANDQTIAELQQRIAELELLVAGGSNDTNQGAALDAGAAVGDDASDGTGDANANLGTMADQDSDDVAITGGSITGIEDLAVVDGGTGASDASTARTNLGLGSMATQASTSVAVTGGTLEFLSDISLNAGAAVAFVSGSTVGSSISPTSGYIGLDLQGGSGQIILNDASGVAIQQSSSNPIGFFGSSGTSKANVTGSRGGNAALQSLLSALSSYGLITDSTT